MNTTQTLQKWGNSSGIRLSKKIIERAKLKPNQTLVISMKGRSIILTPLDTADDFTLETMLEGVTPNNIHNSIDWGVDIGAEQIE